MTYAERNIVYKDTSEKSVTLLKGGYACGRLFGGKLTENGVCPHYMLKETGYGNVPEGVTAGFSASDGSIILVAGGKLYLKTAAATSFIVMTSGLGDDVFFCEYGGSVYLTDGAKECTVSGSTVTSGTAGKALYGGAVHYDRLFGADISDNYCVRWSSAGSTDDWTEGIRNSGWLRFSPEKGGVLQLVPFSDKLIAVREKGLSAVKAYGAAENFRVAEPDSFCPHIAAGTATVCAGNLLFAADDGLYSYDGSDIERFAEDGLEGTGQITQAAAGGNTYYALLTLCGESAVACVDGESGSVSFLKTEAECLFAGGEVYIASGGTLSTLTGGGQSFVWESGYTNLGKRGRKYLKSVYIECGGGCTLSVESGGVSRIFGGVKGKVDVKMPGFDFLFTLEASCPVRSVTAVFDV